MSSSQISRTVTVMNRQGMHARAAVELAKLARTFRAKVTVVKGDQRVDATSVVHLLTLGAAQGQDLQLEAAGEDAPAALDAVADLFARRFGEEETD